MKRYIQKILITLMVFFPFSGSTHEGHGMVEHGPAHYLLSPEHSILLVAVIWGLILVIRKVYYRKTS